MERINFTSAGAISRRAKERMERRDREDREMLRQQVADGLLNEEEARERGALRASHVALDRRMATEGSASLQ